MDIGFIIYGLIKDNLERLPGSPLNHLDLIERKPVLGKVFIEL